MNNQYTPYMSYQQPYISYQQPIQQSRQQVSMQQSQELPQNTPFSQVVYGTYDQAKGYIVTPNMSVMFIDPDKNEVYVRKADGLGKQALETYKYSSLDKSLNDSENKPTAQDFGVKPEQLKDFLTRKDLDDLYLKIEQLQKKINLNSLIEEDK
mgnify:CR=1 FL=1